MVDDNHTHDEKKPRVKDIREGKVIIGKYGPQAVIKKDLFGNIIEEPEEETQQYMSSYKSLSQPEISPKQPNTRNLKQEDAYRT